MNGQISYIIHASLALLVIAGAVVIFQQLPSSLLQDNMKKGCGTVDPSTSYLLSEKGLKGKTLFQQKCASCHHLFKEFTGPALSGFEKRGPWSNREKLYEWIRDPGSFMQHEPYAQSLKDKYGMMMTAFPAMTNDEIDTICEYVALSHQ